MATIHCSGCGHDFENASSCPRCGRPAKGKRRSKRKSTLVYGSPEDDARQAIIPEELLAKASTRASSSPRPSRTSRLSGNPKRSQRTVAGGTPTERKSERPPRRKGGGTVILSNPDDEEAARSEHTPSHRGGRGRYDLARALEEADEAPRMSRLSRLSQLRVTLAGEHSGRTTIMELSGIAESVVAVTDRRLPRSIGRQLLVSILAAVGLILLAIGALVFGSLRWVLLPALFVPIFALVVYGTVKALPRIAARIGDRELPGGVPVWVGGGLTMMAIVAGVLTWGTSEATARVAVAVFPELAPPELREKKEEPPPRKPDADEKLTREREVRVNPGVLWVPPSFSSDDGEFDLILHFHGYPPLVEDSVAESELNALVHITNLGLGGRPYKARFARPDAFDKLIADIEKKAAAMGLENARVRRVAISTWSAGYGALFQILKDPERDTPIDAVLAMDGLHGSFVGGSREVQPESVEPYVALGKEAVAERRLFVITHSAITTAEYASSTESADAILAALDIARQPADAESSPPPVTFTTAVTAFPADSRKWLTAANEAHAGDFHLYAYTGNTPEDHIAHLAQMSVTVLPHLVKRWE